MDITLKYCLTNAQKRIKNSCMTIEDKHLKDIGQFTKELTLGYQRPILSVRETEEGEYYRLVYNFKTRNLQIEDALGLIFTGFISEVEDLKKLYGWLRIIKREGM